VEPLKPERKDFGFGGRASSTFVAGPLESGGQKNGNGSVSKDAASLFASWGYALTPRLGGSEEIREPYLESWVVHSCLRVIADAIQQVSFKIWDGPGDESKPLPEDHPIVKLFSRPNPWTSWSQLTGMGSIHRNLSGEDFWFLADVKGDPIVTGPAAADPMAPIDLPVAIHSISGRNVGDDRGDDGRILNWKIALRSGKEKKYPPASVLHFRDYDPTDPLRGVGPVEVARRQLSIAFQAERYGEATLRSGGPGAFIVYENELSTETQAGFQAEIDQVMEQPRAAGKLKVLTGKPTVVPIPSNPKDMLSIDQLEWSRDVVASLLNVPLPIIGVLDNATYSNMKEAWRQFWLARVAYMLTVEDVINSSFFPRLKERTFNRLRFAFDLSDVAALKADDVELIKAAAEILSKGCGLPFNELLDLVGCQAKHPPSGAEKLYLAQMQTGPSAPRAATPSAPKLLSMLLEELRNAAAHQAP
jgi:HK97 family phage portal protein